MRQRSVVTALSADQYSVPTGTYRKFRSLRFLGGVIAVYAIPKWGPSGFFLAKPWWDTGEASCYVLAEMACNQVRNSSCQLLGVLINLNDLGAPLVPPCLLAV